MRFKLMIGAAALLGLMATVSHTAAETSKDQAATKAALQAFNDYIGQWKGDGETKTGKAEFWKETMDWGWKFNKDEVSGLKITFKESKNFTDGELKFLPDKKKYELTITGADSKKQVYEGEIKRKMLVLTRTDATTMDKYTLAMSTTNEGALFNLEGTVQTGGRGVDKKLFVVRGKKEGASITGGKKNECVVSGGVGTQQVSFNGKTYYVCCSGCAEAFKENPKKFVDEFEKKKK